MAESTFTGALIDFRSALFKCRICFKQKKSLTKIYKNDKNYAAQIFALTGVKIVESQVPAFICQSCLSDLSTATEFRVQCIKSDEEFRKSMKSHEEKKWTEHLKQLLESLNNEDEIDFKSVKCKVEIEQLDDDNESIDFSNHHDDDFDIKEEESKEIPQTKKIESPDFDTSQFAVCEICKKVLSSQNCLRRHMKCVHSTPLVTKKEPRPKIIRRQNQQLFENAKSKNSTCEICNKTLSSNKNLRRHMKAVHKQILDPPSKLKFILKPEKDQEYTCDYCGKICTNRTKINDHIRWHIRNPKKGERPHGPCTVCGGFYRTRDQLVRHEQTHIPKTAEDFWYCDLCGHRFKNRSLLFAHIRSRHIEKIRFYCKLCPEKSFGTKYALGNHRDFVHLKIRKFFCEFCGKGFPKNCKLKLHVRIHTGEKAYKCQYCEKRFIHQTDHMRHEWAHTGRTKYCCQLCRTSCNSKAELETHKCPWKY